MSVLASVAIGVLWAAQAAAPRPAEPQDPDRPTLSLSELKGLRENNIFSPPKPKRVEPPKREERREERRSEPSPPPRPRPAVLTGILVDPATGAPQALFEDRNSESLRRFKEPKFLKAGDELEGFAIESVAPDKVVVRKGETVKELRIGESLPDEGAPAPQAAPEGASKPEAAPASEGQVNQTLEELKKRLNKKRSADEP